MNEKNLGNVTMNSARKLVIGVICLSFALLLFSLLLLYAAHWRTQHSPPFWGRTVDESPHPAVVTVGPIDPTEGMAGTLSPRMSRRQVESRLGAPIMRAMTQREAADLGLDRPDPYQLYGGPYVFVAYDNQDFIRDFRFELDAYSRRFRGRQEVVVESKGKSVVLHNGLSKAGVVSLLRDKLGFQFRPERPEQHSNLQFFVVGTGMVCEFAEHGRLTAVDFSNEVYAK